MLSRLNNPILALLAVAAFLALAWYSMQSRMASSDEVNAFVAKQLAEYRHPLPVSQVQALYEIWNLTEADVARPVELFVEGERL